MMCNMFNIQDSISSCAYSNVASGLGFTIGSCRDCVIDFRWERCFANDITHGFT